MENIKREVLDMSNKNIAKLNVTRGENLTELYIQNNMMTELDISENKMIEILDCTGNPLKCINALAPDGYCKFPLRIEAGKGGYVGLKLSSNVQEYHATAEEGYEFEGWYNEIGDRLSRDAIWSDQHGASRIIVAAFREK